MRQEPRRRLILGIKTFNRLNYLRSCLLSWHLTRERQFEWKLIVADDGSTDGTLEFLRELSGIDITVIANHRRYAVGQFNTILQRLDGTEYDACFMADDDVLFLRPGWDSHYLACMGRSGFGHLCWFDRDYWRLAWPRRPLPAQRVDPSGSCAGSVVVDDCLGAFLTVTPHVVASVGYADENSFPTRGQWHVDYSMRCVRAGWNRGFPFYDALKGDRLISVQDLHVRHYVGAIAPESAEFRTAVGTEEMTRRLAIMRQPDRVYLPFERARGAASASSTYASR